MSIERPSKIDYISSTPLSQLKSRSVPRLRLILMLQILASFVFARSFETPRPWPPFTAASKKRECRGTTSIYPEGQLSRHSSSSSSRRKGPPGRMWLLRQTLLRCQEKAALQIQLRQAFLLLYPQKVALQVTAVEEVAEPVGRHLLKGFPLQAFLLRVRVVCNPACPNPAFRSWRFRNPDFFRQKKNWEPAFPSPTFPRAIFRCKQTEFYKPTGRRPLTIETPSARRMHMLKTRHLIEGSGGRSTAMLGWRLCWGARGQGCGATRETWNA